MVQKLNLISHWEFILDAHDTALVLCALGGRLRPEDANRYSNKLVFE